MPVACLIVLLGAVWGWHSSGIVSSNDGSHVALARALALRGETPIDPDVGLTLWVDRARRGEHDYSDRPPGTAFAASWAVWAAAPLDERWQEVSLQRLRNDPSVTDPAEALVVRPATDRFLSTYGKRRLEVGGSAVNLLALQGTALTVAIHGVLLGLCGTLLVLTWLRRAGVDLPGRMFAGLCLGLATLWGPYSTALFSHVTAGVGLMALCVALQRGREATQDRAARRFAVLAGVAGSWAVASDYALVLAVVPLSLLVAPPRMWPFVIAGALPIAIATGLYHEAAFGSPLSIGYDHQSNFAFARERGSTFSGNPLHGAWVLWGLGRGAGMLAQSPVALLGLLGLVDRRHRRWLYGLLPWMLLLLFHRTPWGGATLDHRYLVPAMPLCAVGLGLLWQRAGALPDSRRRALLGAMLALAAMSGVLVWSNFLAWRG